MTIAILRKLAVAAVAAAAVLLPSAALAAPGPQTKAAIVAPAPNKVAKLWRGLRSQTARVIGAHRARVPATYVKDARPADFDDGWAVASWREAVRVEVEVYDASSRTDEEGAWKVITLTLDPADLTPAQTEAMSRPYGARAARFAPRVTSFTRTASAVSEESSICSGEGARCNDRIVFQDRSETIDELSVVEPASVRSDG